MSPDVAVAVPAEITLASAAGALAALQAARAAAPGALELDLAPLVRFDSAAVAVLVALRREAGVPVALRRALPAVSVEGRLLWAAPFGMDRDARWPRAGACVALAWDCDDPGDPRARWTARPPATGAPPSL